MSSKRAKSGYVLMMQRRTRLEHLFVSTSHIDVSITLTKCFFKSGALQFVSRLFYVVISIHICCPAITNRVCLLPGIYT
jgi:hypothetical protein